MILSEFTKPDCEQKDHNEETLETENQIIDHTTNTNNLQIIQ